ncbi:MAG: hypothetical protein Q4E41_10045 [Bacteroidales bacterium]|nr:hypothetical protein [Bacteroidales bacterium]
MMKTIVNLKPVEEGKEVLINVEIEGHVARFTVMEKCEMFNKMVKVPRHHTCYAVRYGDHQMVLADSVHDEGTLYAITHLRQAS